MLGLTCQQGNWCRASFTAEAAARLFLSPHQEDVGCVESHRLNPKDTPAAPESLPFSHCFRGETGPKMPWKAVGTKQNKELAVDAEWSPAGGRSVPPGHTLLPFRHKKDGPIFVRHLSSSGNPVPGQELGGGRGGAVCLLPVFISGTCPMLWDFIVCFICQNRDQEAQLGCNKQQTRPLKMAALGGRGCFNLPQASNWASVKGG